MSPRYLLDTNALISLFTPDRLLLRFVQAGAASEFATSAVVIHELYFGAYNSARIDRNVAEFDKLAFPALHFDRADAVEAGRVRAELKRAGTPIGILDTLIAGQALARGLVVVTRNVREFRRVTGLQVQNW